MELISLFKSQAQEIGKNLNEDKKVIENITTKQDKVQKSLERETKNVEQLNNNNPLGFGTLLCHSLVAVLLWLFTMIFILIF